MFSIGDKVLSTEFGMEGYIGIVVGFSKDRETDEHEVVVNWGEFGNSPDNPRYLLKIEGTIEKALKNAYNQGLKDAKT